jgi:hypothetical protein
MSVFLKGCGFKPRRNSEEERARKKQRERKSDDKESEEGEERRKMAALRFVEELDLGWRRAFSACDKPSLF